VILRGVGASGGRACAPLLIHRRAAPAAPAAERPAGPDVELARVAAASERARRDLSVLRERTRTSLGDDAAAIVAVQLELLVDPEWIDPIRARVRDGAAAEAAVHEVSEALAADLAGLEDEYLRERAADLRDLGGRLVRALAGVAEPSLGDRLADGEFILAAHDLTPTDTLGLDSERVRGIVTETGGRTSHTAIVARSLGIPAVVGVAGLLDGARDGELAAIDGDGGAVHLPPDVETEASFRAAPRPRRHPVLTARASTRDGVAVHVLANAGSPEEVARAVELGADGIGLYRTEMLFLQAATVPDEAQLAASYRAAVEASAGRPVTFRTLDIGGDKELPALGVGEERNAFLGVRGLRLSLRRPELFGAQLRALAQAARVGDVRVMVPMVTTVGELRRAGVLAAEAGLRAPLGAMVEVPAAALQARRLCAEAAFLSVGTNDLTQYLLAVDRTSAALGALYDDLHPSVLGVLAGVAVDAGGAGRPVAVCGELAARPGAAVLLVGLGLRELSVAAAAVPRVKADLAAVTLPEAEALARRALDAEDGDEVGALLAELDGG
jgi:phosphotransferase system enzyme I (PtsI)